jgi:spermidine synthase
LNAGTPETECRPTSPIRSAGSYFCPHLRTRISDAVDLLLKSGRTIDAIRMDGWRIDVGYPEDRERAEERLQEQAPAAD